MEPTFFENDVIVVNKSNINELKENDIITFKQNDKIISHRIIKINKENGRLIFNTKGDNNIIEDDFKIAEEQIYGKVLFRIPKIGKIVQYMQREKGLVKVIIIVIIIFILFSMNDNKKNKRKITRKKYELKKSRENYNNL